MKSRLLTAILFAIASSTAAGCASMVPRRTSRAAGPSLHGEASEAARLRSIPQDPQQAFLEGYKAYRAHDLGRAADCLRIAERAPQLGDYALYYLGLSEEGLGHDTEAEAAMRRLLEGYPRSVFQDRAELEIAKLELREGRAGDAAAAAARVAGRTVDADSESDARLLMARALLALNDRRGAYEQLETLRNRYPRAGSDAAARDLERSLLSAHPEVVDVETLEFHRGEAELLLKEGVNSEALAQIDDALRLSPPPSMRAEFLWLEARASRSDPARAKRALTDYLAVMPRGAETPAALDQLARIYWREDDTERARVFFRRLAGQFPSSSSAPNAMLEIGWTLEDDGALDKARAQYERLYARYPRSEAASEARFRAAFILYISGEYQSAARRFGTMAERIRDGPQRDMYLYWRGRALEDGGETRRSREIFEQVALSLDSNYYPALAGNRAGVAPRFMPGASAPEPAPQAPQVGDENAGFHLKRVVALRELGLKELEPAELERLEHYAQTIPSLREFVLAWYRDAGAWHNSVEAATSMAGRGEIAKDAAERLRYPRAYWDLIAPAAARERLDPYLLLSLARQESLFDPRARSSADARGLMQLLPATANRVAADTDQPDLYDPAVSVKLGSAYLRRLLDIFRGDQFKAIAAYNAGEHAVESWNARFSGDDDEWVENIGYRETRDYVKKVIGGMREYRLLYRPQPEAVSSGARP